MSISGLLEISPINTVKDSTQAASGATATTNVKTSSTAKENTWATSVLNFSATEDLGGGLKATAVMISDVSGGFANRERTLALAGDFGAVRMGRFVPAAAVGFHAFSGAGSSTLAGSVYALSQASSSSRNIQTGTANFERQDNVLQYTSPTISGFTANLAYARNSSDSDAAALTGKAEGQQTSLHIAYAAGPLNVGFGFNSRTDSTEGTAAVAAVTPDVTTTPITLGSVLVPAKAGTTTDTDLQWIGASYNFGVATVFATNAQRDAKSAGVTSTDVSVNAIGVAVPMGAFTFRASTYAGKDKRAAAATDDMKLTGNQLSVNYALSKRTSVIAATGQNTIKRDGASTAATRKVTGNTLTMVHTF